VAEKAPIALVLEDLHWADSESLLLLDFVASELRENPVLVIGTYRDVELAATAAVAKLLAALARVADRVALRGLSVDEVGGLLAGGGEAAPSVQLVAAVHRATGGNPFFVGEIAELMRSDGASFAEGFRVPDTVREVIRRRLDPLPGATRRLLQHGAILGLDFVLEPLAAIVATTAARVLEDLEPALRSGLVAETRRPRRYRFAHALLQHSLLDELGVVERAELHRRSGEAIERLYAADLTPILGELAHHFRQSAALGTSAKAVAYATRAGDRAIASLGFEEAAGHYGRALRSDRGEAREPSRRLELLLKFGDAQRCAGDEDGAHATLHEAAGLARDRGDAVALARAAVRVVASTAERGAVDEPLVELVEAALAGLGPGESPLRARLLGALARTLYFAPDPARREAASRDAVALARRVGDPAVLAAVLTDRHFTLWRPGTVVERLALIEETISLALESGHPEIVSEARAWRILDLIELGRFAEADRDIAEHAAMAARTRIPRSIWHATLVRAARALFDGRIDEAEALSQHALETRATRTRNNAVQFHAVQAFEIHLARGRLPELADELAALSSRPGMPPIWHSALALMEVACGRPEHARARLVELTKDDFAVLPRDATWLPALAALAELSDALGDGERAAQVHAALRPHRGLTIVTGFGALIHGLVDRFLGLCELSMGRNDEAVCSLEDALAAAGRIGATAEVIRIEVVLARALAARARSGDSSRAEELGAAARAKADAIGAPGLIFGVRGRSRPSPEWSPPSRLGGRASDAVARAGLRREGAFWTLSCGTEVTRLKDTKGVAYLFTLLRRPGEEFHALDIARGSEEPRATGDAGAAIDPEAGRAYRRRLAELGRELELGGGADAERLAAEREALERELARATGLAGRVRRSGSEAERARLNVTRAIAAVVKKIAAEFPRVGRHLEATVRTGTFCSYEPGPSPPIEWEE
jgi:tetratricopeptide (TPR) repeat protein